MDLIEINPPLVVWLNIPVVLAARAAGVSDILAYRIAVTLRDKRRIPWTSYYTSGVASKRAIVALTREFLELEPSPVLGSNAPTATTERDLRRGVEA